MSGRTIGHDGKEEFKPTTLVTQYKERPILFSGPMVRAILEGRKTQTRRIVKLKDPSGTYSVHDDDGWPCTADECGDWHRDRCKFGEVGDRLWVRETFTELRDGHEHDITRTHRRGLLTNPVGLPKVNSVEYRADASGSTDSERCRKELGYKWKPSIFMPRWASRITLEITGVRVERLNDISEANAKAEGVDPGCLTCGENCVTSGGCGCCNPSYRDSFIGLWHTINGPNSWMQNPWVWVVEFKRVTA